MCVITEKSPGITGMATDYGNFPYCFMEGKGAVIFQQDNAFFRRTAGKPRSFFLIKYILSLLGTQSEGMFKKPHAEFGFQHTKHSLVQPG